MKNYNIAVAIALSTIIYVFGNRYTPMELNEGFSFDKFTGTAKKYFVNASRK